MLKEVVIVEGKSDIAAVKRAIDADCIATGGFHLTKNVLRTVSGAYNRRGIIILTDPDSAGENIRNFLSKNFIFLLFSTELYSSELQISVAKINNNLGGSINLCEFLIRMLRALELIPADSEIDIYWIRAELRYIRSRSVKPSFTGTYSRMC